MMQHYPKVSVVILNWNGKHYLEKFLPTLLESTYPNLEIIVGDNASTDNSVHFLSKQFSKIKIIENEKNLGFAAGYNQVLSKVDADYLVLLNSDVEVTPGWIEPVIALIESDENIAAAQPKIKWWKNKHQFEYAGAAGGFIDQFGYPFCRGRIFDTLEEDTGQYNDLKEVFWASGAALFIRKSCWDEADGFDADFFAHMEEIDLCWRLKNLGYKIMYCSDATVYHVGGGTLDSGHPYKTYLNFKNNLSMLLKNLKANQVFLILFIRFWLDFISLLKFLLEGKLEHVRAINKAHVAFFTNFSRDRKKRTKKHTRFNDTGMYKGSIVLQYFALKKKYFSGILK